MAHLEGNLHRLLTGEGSIQPTYLGGVLPRVVADEVAGLHTDVLAILVGGVIALTDQDDIAADVLLHDEPGAATQPEALALTDGVEPVALVLAEDLPCLTLDDEPFLLSEGALDELVVVHLPEEADALTVLAVSAQQMRLFSDTAYLALEEVTGGEEELGDLAEVDLRKEVRLVLHGVGSRSQIELITDEGRRGVVPRSDEVEVLAPLLLEAAELDELIAHHVGVGGETTAHGVDGVLDDVRPILVV